jgi:hypothetical protein
MLSPGLTLRQQARRIFGGSTREASQVAEDRMNR